MQKNVWSEAPVLATCAVATGLTASMGSIFPLWVIPWTSEFNVSRGSVLLLLAVTGMASILLAPFVGRLLTKIAPWKLMLAGCVAAGVALIAIAACTAFWQIATLYAVGVSAGMLLAGPVCTQALAISRVPDHSGVVGGVTMLGIGVGSAVLPLILGPVLGGEGWRPAIAIAGALILCLAGGMTLLFARKPAVASASHSAAAAATLTTGQILGSRAFWVIILSTIPILAVAAALQANLIALLADRGVGASDANYVLAAIPAASAISSVVIGTLSDRIDPRILVLCLAAIALAALGGVILNADYPLTAGALITLGFASGGCMPLMTNMQVRAFGAENYAPVAGLMYPFLLPLALSPAIVGAMRDQSGSYAQALLVSVPLVVLSGLVIWLFRSRTNGAAPVTAAA